jgi:hypothetical protein
LHVTAATDAAIRLVAQSGRADLILSATTDTLINNISNTPLIFATNSSERIRITANGNVGIGNSTPDARLTVTGTANVSGNTVVGGSLSAANVTATVFTGSLTGTASNATNLNSQPGSFYTNATNISTGTVNASRLSGTYTIDVTGTASNATNLNSQPASFYTNATNLATGTVNAARLSGTYTIDVTGTASNATNLNNQPGSFYTNATNLATGTVPTARLASGTANTITFLRGDQTWATVVGGAVLTANNTDTQTFYLPMANATSGSWSNGVVSTTKLFFVPSTGTLNATIFNSLSDEQEKTNVADIPDSLDMVLALRGVEFNWRDNGSKSAGLIAQELEKTLPHLVSTSEAGTKSVNYNGIIAYLIEAIRELNNKLENRDG